VISFVNSLLKVQSRTVQGRWQKNFQGEGDNEIKDRKIAQLNLPLLYQYHLWFTALCPPLPTPMWLWWDEAGLSKSVQNYCNFNLRWLHLSWVIQQIVLIRHHRSDMEIC